MNLMAYIRAKAIALWMAGIAGLYMMLVSCLCGLPFSLVLLVLLSGMGVMLLCMLMDWRNVSRRLKMLKSRLETLPEKHLIGETLEKPHDAVELEYYLLMKEISRSAIGAAEQARADKQDYCDYVESWVHEIKTPLTACSLILANGGDSVKLRRELRRADNLIETILTYAKLRTAEKDTQIALTELREVCGKAIREEMELLIAVDIGISLDGCACVYTDAKLLVFMIKQLLINCAKYCPGCRIRIALEEGLLCLEDDGPGIPAHELPRVTERGFSGSAGRAHGGSTGMGLYIVSQLAEKLGIDMRIASEENHFTRFLFQFPAGI